MQEPPKDIPEDRLFVSVALGLYYKFSFNYKHIGSGASRSAWEYRGGIAKLPVSDACIRFYEEEVCDDRTRDVLASWILTGIWHNWQELDFYTNNRTNLELAEILDYQETDIVNVLTMEKLDHAQRWTKFISDQDPITKLYRGRLVSLPTPEGLVLPEWIKDAPDDCQGGFDKNKVFKIFDYSDIYDRIEI